MKVVTFSLAAPFAIAALAQETTLLLPGFDPQPISGEIIGVNEQQETTWRLLPITTGDEGDIGIPLNGFTAVQGATMASLHLEIPSNAGETLAIDVACSFASPGANEGVCSRDGEVATVTGLAEQYLTIQVGGTGTGGPSATAAPGSGSEVQVTAPTSNTAAPAETSANGTRRMEIWWGAFPLASIAALALF